MVVQNGCKFPPYKVRTFSIFVQVLFSLNGVWVGEESGMFSHVKTGFFAAASFMSLNQCQFNFGHNPFTFPPPKHIDFKTFNDHSHLKPEEKIVLPR